MIAISIANSVGSRRSSAPVVVVPVATAATGVGETSFTANWNAFAGANYYLLDVSLNSSFSSFVGSYQNYVTIGTSQLVSGLTPNTTYYYRLRAVTGVDSDAAAFFSRVYTAGGVLSYTEVTATETLVYDMKTAGVWTAMKAVYPMVGASAAACAQNLKSSSFTGAFTSGWTFASTGVTPNGASYMETNLSPSANLALDSVHMSYYSRTNIIDTQMEMGVYRSVASLCYLIFNYSGLGFSAINCADAPRTSPANPTTGFLIGSRISSTEEKYYTNNVSQTRIANSNSLDSNQIYVGAGNSGLYSTKQCAFASIGDGLTDTQASDFYTAVQTFNQTLNRQVGAQIVSDADAQAYINRVYTAGGTLTNTEANAVNQLVIDMKGAGIWTAMKAVYPMVGSSAAACAQNLVSSSFTGTFTSGWTFASTGVTPNGTSAYFDTALNPSTQLTKTTAHLSTYIRTNSNSGQPYDIGNSGNTGATTTPTYLISRYSNDNAYFGIADTSYATSISSTNSLGFWCGATNGSSTQKLYKNGSSIVSGSAASGGFANNNIYIGANNGAGTATLFSNKQTAFASIGDGLTDTQASNFYTAVQIFNTTLGRQVAG